MRRGLALGNGPVGNSAGTGRMFHLGTNYGSDSWCYQYRSPWAPGEYSATSSGPLLAPDYWCPDCVKVCLEIHGVEPPVPSTPLGLIGSANLRGALHGQCR